MRSREMWQGRGPKLLANRFHTFNETMKVLYFWHSVIRQKAGGLSGFLIFAKAFFMMYLRRNSEANTKEKLVGV